MCDYSLEFHRSRPAQLGERYETHRFEGRSIGFIAPGDPLTAVCMACDTRLRLEDVPEMVQRCCSRKVSDCNRGEDSPATLRKRRTFTIKSVPGRAALGYSAPNSLGRVLINEHCLSLALSAWLPLEDLIRDL
jgi:hypothetical protein